MINNSYEITLETYGTEEHAEQFTQSQSSEPSDDFTQKYGAEYNSYKYHETEEQYGETSNERHKREQESDKEIFRQCLNKKKWQQRRKEHRRQQEEGGEDNIDLQRDENSYRTNWFPVYNLMNKESQQSETKDEKKKKDRSMKGRKRKQGTYNQEGSEESKRIFDLHEKEKEQQSQHFVNQLDELRKQHKRKK